ncbi:MAG: hypothetical protein V9E88_02225 [Ferruginibacter sp.]
MNNTTPKYKILVLMITVLLISNAVLLYFLFSQKPAEEKRERQSREQQIINYLKNELKFTDEQMTQYNGFSKNHMKEVKTLFDSLSVKRKKILKQLVNNNFTDSAIAQASMLINKDQYEIDNKMMIHLKTIHQLCSPDQKAIFDTGFYKIMGRRGGNVKSKK